MWSDLQLLKVMLLHLHKFQYKKQRLDLSYRQLEVCKLPHHIFLKIFERVATISIGKFGLNLQQLMEELQHLHMFQYKLQKLDLSYMQPEVYKLYCHIFLNIIYQIYCHFHCLKLNFTCNNWWKSCSTPICSSTSCRSWICHTSCNRGASCTITFSWKF